MDGRGGLEHPNKDGVPDPHCLDFGSVGRVVAARHFLSLSSLGLPLLRLPLPQVSQFSVQRGAHTRTHAHTLSLPGHWEGTRKGSEGRRGEGNLGGTQRYVSFYIVDLTPRDSGKDPRPPMEGTERGPGRLKALGICNVAFHFQGAIAQPSPAARW